ncbi:MAG: hypothetical protein EBY22_12600, partial [Gammaproteobacteria bacterium]|nr:hypothetical protein [Gammaproteobacteria bacterium]
MQLPFRSRPQHIHGVATAGIPAKFKLYANCKLAVPAVASITLFFSLFLTAFNIGHIVLAIVVLWLVIHFMPFEGWLKEELDRLDNTHYQLLCQLDATIREFNFPPEYQRYQQKSVYLSGMIARFRQLPEEYNEMKTAVEEQLYNEQLGYFLSGFRIENYDIPSIGNVRKEALTRNGITTAADISLLGQIKVPGIGPKNHQLLLSWQRQMSSGFTYFPDFGKIAAEVLKVNTQFNNIKLKLEAEIRAEYRNLTYMKANISNRAALLDAKINEV